MKASSVFKKSGNSQAVRLPKDAQFAVSMVEIFRRGNAVAGPPLGNDELWIAADAGRVA